MSGRRSRSKGARTERSIVNAQRAKGIAAVRVPLSGALRSVRAPLLRGRRPLMRPPGAGLERRARAKRLHPCPRDRLRAGAKGWAKDFHTWRDTSPTLRGIEVSR